jgi:hypothetical protein
MPLTLSHPAAVLPLGQQRFIRRFLPFSALVIGSVVPDLPYFLPRLPWSTHSHTLLGLFFFCLPAGLILLGIFHTWLKIPLLALLPESHQRRLTPLAKPFFFMPAQRSLGIILAVLAGALTHLLWDSFTHANGWAVIHLPILDRVVVTIGWHPIHLYSLLQHGSSLLGGLVLIYAYRNWYRSAPALGKVVPGTLSPAGRIILVVGMATAAVLLALSFGLAGIASLETISQLRLFAGRSAVAGIATLGLELLVFCTAWQILKLQKAFQG